MFFSVMAFINRLALGRKLFVNDSFAKFSIGWSKTLHRHMPMTGTFENISTDKQQIETGTESVSHVNL